MTDPIVWFAATAFVFIHALDAFDSPPTSRSFTTAARYYAAAAFYVLTFLLLFAIISRSPELKRWLVNGLPDGKPEPFFAALIVTVLVPALPPLNTIDDRLRAFLQRVAAIPLQALRLSDMLRTSTLTVSDSDRQAIRSEILRLDFRAVDIVFEREPTYQYMWTRISTLRHFVKRWELSEGRLTATRSHFRQELELIDDRYMLLSLKAKRLFQRIPRGADPINDEYAAESTRDFIDGAEDLEKRLYELISRAALHRNITEHACTEELRDLGFDIEVREGKPLSDKLAVLFMALVAWYVAMNLLMPPASAVTLGPLQILVLAGSVAATHCLAVYWALIVKDTDVARRSRGRLGWLSYAIACALALVTALMTTFALQLFFTRGIHEALAAMGARWPWALMAIATALMTSINCDTEIGGKYARVVQAGGQAAVTVLFALVVRRFLDMQGVPVRPVWQFCVMTGVTGAMIGGFVPSWYREWARPQETATRTAETAAAPDAIAA